jgi:hypothetical protein
MEHARATDRLEPASIPLDILQKVYETAGSSVLHVGATRAASKSPAHRRTWTAWASRIRPVAGGPAGQYRNFPADNRFYASQNPWPS